MMKEEPFFLVNEFLEKEKKEIQSVLEIIQVKNYRKNQRAIFLRNLTNELFKAHKKNKSLNLIDNNEREKIKKEKESLLKKREDLLNKLKYLQEQKTEVKQENINVKDLILSKETGKTLVKTEFDEINYKVIEPVLSLNDMNLLDELKTRADNIDNKEEFVKQIMILCSKYNIGYNEEYYDKIRYYLIRDLKKYGKVSPLIEDKEVKEIVCAGINKLITINYKDKEEVQTNLMFNTAEELNGFINQLAKMGEKKVSEESPFLDLEIDNLKIQATLGSEFFKSKFIISKL